MAYELTILRVGATVKNPEGKEVYFQPGDDTATIIETFEALEEIECPNARNRVADIALSDYFEGN